MLGSDFNVLYCYIHLKGNVFNNLITTHFKVNPRFLQSLYMKDVLLFALLGFGNLKIVERECLTCCEYLTFKNSDFIKCGTSKPMKT